MRADAIPVHLSRILPQDQQDRITKLSSEEQATVNHVWKTMPVMSMLDFQMDVMEQDSKESPTPDPALKGKQGKNCNRTACQKPGATYYNATMNAWYCPSCARQINKWQVLSGDPLCVRDEQAEAMVRETRENDNAATIAGL